MCHDYDLSSHQVYVHVVYEISLKYLTLRIILNDDMLLELTVFCLIHLIKLPVHDCIITFMFEKRDKKSPINKFIINGKLLS